MKTVLVTGAAGFIGSALVREMLDRETFELVAVDKLTYAGNLRSLSDVQDHERLHFFCEDICDRATMDRLFAKFRPDGVIHLAAESHVDRSIDGPMEFVRTNVVGTATLLQSALDHWRSLSPGTPPDSSFRFHHVSTDEVYGDLGDGGGFFTEETPYDPTSPYSATKASSDHLVRAWGRTYGLPYLITNCTNNYGPRQFPEKLIPHMILTALEGRPLPVYGDGCQVRDWLYVEDHARALIDAFLDGAPGETYNIGGRNERRNIEVIRTICGLLEKHAVAEKPAGISRYEDLITFVTDRPGHDARYAIDPEKIENATCWKPRESFESGLENTVKWYLSNREWWQAILSGDYLLERMGEQPTAADDARGSAAVGS